MEFEVESVAAADPDEGGEEAARAYVAWAHSNTHVSRLPYPLWSLCENASASESSALGHGPAHEAAAEACVLAIRTTVTLHNVVCTECPPLRWEGPQAKLLPTPSSTGRTASCAAVTITGPLVA